MMDFSSLAGLGPLWDLLAQLTILVIGLVTEPIMEWVQKGAAWLERANPTTKRFAVVLIAWGLTQLSSLLGVHLPHELGALTGGDVSALLSAAVAFAVHAGRKAKETS